MFKLRKNFTNGIGQGIVEFALVIPLLLMIVVGIFEAGRAIYIYQAVSTASREAARLGSSASYYLDCDAIQQVALNIGAPGNVTVADIAITYDSGPGSANLGSCPVNAEEIELGDRVVVQVTGYFEPAASIPLFNFPSIPFSSTTRRTIIKQADLSDPGIGP